MNGIDGALSYSLVGGGAWYVTDISLHHVVLLIVIRLMDAPGARVEASLLIAAQVQFSELIKVQTHSLCCTELITRLAVGSSQGKTAVPKKTRLFHYPPLRPVPARLLFQEVWSDCCMRADVHVRCNT